MIYVYSDCCRAYKRDEIETSLNPEYDFIMQTSTEHKSKVFDALLTGEKNLKACHQLQPYFAEFMCRNLLSGKFFWCYIESDFKNLVPLNNGGHNNKEIPKYFPSLKRKLNKWRKIFNLFFLRIKNFKRWNIGNVLYNV